MKFFLIFLIVSNLILAQEEKKDSPIVEAAKKTGKYKFKNGLKITNDGLVTQSEKGKETKKDEQIKKKENIELETEYKDNKGRTKEDWQKMMQEAKDNLSKWETKVKELESELNKLTNDYYAWDDVAYREGVIKVNMDKTREELEKAKIELEKAKERIPELEEEARKSGALPGWLR